MTEESTKTSEVAQPRRKLGKYELVERFERGGMATVYKAYDPALDRYVAVKQIAAHLAEDPRFIERFRHEAQVLAKLGDEAQHVVTIHELVEDEAGGRYIVMEYVEGKTLEAFLESAPIPPAAAVKLLGQIARGLRAVHQKGIIHRDIKPLNVIITPQGRVKITDFGLAAQSGGDTSMSMGTTKYMAPELFQGGPIDGRADLYSLGFMMYELLCPVDRFNEVFEDVLKDERSEALRWMSWHADRERTVPSLVEVNPKVPRRLSAIVERLMAKDLNQRFFSAEELLGELKARFGRGSAGTSAVSGDLSKSQMARAKGAPEAGPAGAAPAAGRKPGPGDTAPLPQPPNWRKRAILIGAAVLVLIVGLLVLRKVLRAERDRAIRTANENYAAANEDYTQGRYQAAAEKYGIVLDKVGTLFPDSDMVKNTRMYRAMAEAYVLRDERKWAETDERLNLADSLGFERDKIRRFRGQMAKMQTFYQLLARAEEAAKKGLFDDALKLLTEAEREDPERPEVGVLRTDVLYAKAMQEGADALDRADFDTARRKFTEAKGLKDTPAVETRLADLKTNEAFYRALSDGQAALNRGDFASAIRDLGRAVQLQPDDKRAQDLLLQARYQQKFQEAERLKERGLWAEAMKAYEEAKAIKDTGEVRGQMAAAKGEMELANLMDEANKAEAAGDLDKAIDFLVKARARRRSLELDARITDLQYRRAMARGRAFEQDAKWAEAEGAYREAYRIKGTPEAEQAVKQMQTRGEYEKLVEEGDNFYKANLPERAIESYQKAQEKIPGQEIERRIADCRYDIYMRIGKEQEEMKNFNEAYANYRLALKQKSTPEVLAAIERVRPQAQP